MAAFERAVRLGYRYLETDVRVTADGVALAFHDATLDRVTDRRGHIDALPWSQVRRARIAGREPVALLADLLAAWPDVRVNLDVKADSGVAAAAEAIERTGTVSRVCIAAFSTRRISALQRRLGPQLCTALGPGEALGLRLARGPVRRRYAGRCAQVPYRLGGVAVIDAGYVAAAHRLGVQVHAWTVNAVSDMTTLLDLGVDGIITDRADVLRELLVARGQWPRAS